MVCSFFDEVEGNAVLWAIISRSAALHRTAEPVTKTCPAICCLVFHLFISHLFIHLLKPHRLNREILLAI